MEDLGCDFALVFEKSDHAKLVLQNFRTSFRNFHEKLGAKLTAAAAFENECAKKEALYAEKVQSLQQEMEEVKSELDAVKLQQKVVDKKILNMVKQEERLEKEVDEAKKTRDALSLEIVDYQDESEERKKAKKAKWDAIKRACHIYQENLDFHIHLESEKDYDRVTVSFFTQNDSTRRKYYVSLIEQNNQWRVERIEPTLKKEHLKELLSDTEISKQSEITDITAFLCQLRQILMKYYMNAR